MAEKCAFILFEGLLWPNRHKRQKLAGLYLSPASISFLRRRNLLDGRRPNTFKELCRGRRVKGAAPDNRERTHVDTLV